VALGKWVCRETTTPAYTIASAITPETVRVTVNLDKVRKARDSIRKL
jgi:hypothetical protein